MQNNKRADRKVESDDSHGCDIRNKVFTSLRGFWKVDRRRVSQKQKKEKTEGATGLARITREQTEKWNQMTTLTRIQSSGRGGGGGSKMSGLRSGREDVQWVYRDQRSVLKDDDHPPSPPLYPLPSPPLYPLPLSPPSLSPLSLPPIPPLSFSCAPDGI